VGFPLRRKRITKKCDPIKGILSNYKNPTPRQKKAWLCFLFSKNTFKLKKLGHFFKPKNPQLSLWVFLCGERGTNQISKNQLYKGLGKTPKTIDTFNKL